MKWNGLSRAILSFTVALFLLAQLFVSGKWMLDNIALINEQPNRSYDEKMRIKWNGYYDLMVFVKDATPPDAAILIDSTSHINLDLYFLYPRRIFYDRDLVARTQSIDYIVLTGDVPAPVIQGVRKMLDDKRGLIQLRP